MKIRLKSGLVYENVIKITFEYRKLRGFFKKERLFLVVLLDLGEQEPYEGLWCPEVIDSIES